MRNGCAADNLPAPEFKIAPATFSICFLIRSSNKAMQGESMKGDSYRDDFGVNFGLNFGLNATQQKIIELMLANSYIKTQEIADAADLTKRSVEYAIRALKKAGLVERIGAAKNGRWVVNQAARCFIRH